MKIASAAYPLDWFHDFGQYEAKLTAWIGEAAGQRAELLVFPEYGAMELASLEGAEVANDMEAALQAVAQRLPGRIAACTGTNGQDNNGPHWPMTAGSVSALTRRSSRQSSSDEPDCTRRVSCAPAAYDPPCTINTASVDSDSTR